METIAETSSNIEIRFLIDLCAVFILVRFIYFPFYKNKDLFLMFFIFNLIIFFITWFLNKVNFTIGTTFGLFAVFQMLRYSTNNISIKNMTYLFLAITIALVSSIPQIKNIPDSYLYFILGGINAFILIITYLLESSVFIKREMTKLIVYENTELVQSNRKEELLEEIRNRTGINVHRISIEKINFLEDAAQIKIYYYNN